MSEGGSDRKDLAKWMADTTPVIAGFVVNQVAQHHGADGYVSAGLGLMATRIAAIFTPASQRRLEPWLRGMLGGRPMDHAESVAFWDRVKEREAAQEAVYVAADRLRSILDPAAAEVLGRLTAEYVEADRFPDAFFRDLSSALIEIQRDELEEWICLWKWASRFDEEYVDMRFELERDANANRAIAFFRATDQRGHARKMLFRGERYVARDATERLLRLLSTTGLVERFARGDNEYIDVRRAVVTRLSSLLNPLGAQ